MTYILFFSLIFIISAMQPLCLRHIVCKFKTDRYVNSYIKMHYKVITAFLQYQFRMGLLSQIENRCVENIRILSDRYLAIVMPRMPIFFLRENYFGI